MLSTQSRSASVCVSFEQQLSTEPPRGGRRRASSSGSDSPDVSALEAGRVKQRQAARRSKSDRIQGPNKPRVKRRERNLALDLASVPTGSEYGLSSSNDTDAFLRKAPSAGRIMGSYYDTPDDSPKSFQRLAGTRPPIPVITTPDASPTLNKKIAGIKQGSKSRGTERSPTVRNKESGHRRSGSVRATGTRKSTFLDVPDPASKDQNRTETADDSYCLRSFDLTRKGVVNRGDSFRRRRSRSNSLAAHQQQQLHDFLLEQKTSSSSGSGSGPPNQASSPVATAAAVIQAPAGQHENVSSYRVAIIGAHGVGKTALISQFMTSECINAYDRTKGEDEQEQPVFVMLNGEESELIFSYYTNVKTEMNRSALPDAYVLMYSVIDKASFQRAEDELARLQNWDALRGRALIVVGNKTDLVRSRAVSAQDGKCLACAYRAKFTEISVVINHNVDELLVGILTQIRLKKDLQGDLGASDQSGAAEASGGPSSGSWTRNKSLVRASMKAKQMFTWLFGKDDDQFTNCENLHIL